MAEKYYQTVGIGAGRNLNEKQMTALLNLQAAESGQPQGDFTEWSTGQWYRTYNSEVSIPTIKVLLTHEFLVGDAYHFNLSELGREAVKMTQAV